MTGDYRDPGNVRDEEARDRLQRALTCGCCALVAGIVALALSFLAALAWLLWGWLLA